MANAVVVLPQEIINGHQIQNGHHPSNSAVGTPMAKTTNGTGTSSGNSFWYLDNPSTRIKKDVYSGPYEGKKTVLVMVGLPGRGKTYMAKKVSRYFKWLGYSSEVFNCSDYLRKDIASGKKTVVGCESLRDSQDWKAEAQRDLWSFIDNGGQVGVYDGTIVKASDRQELLEEAQKRSIQCLFVEIVCDDSAIVTANINQFVLHAPEYQTIDKDEAVKDINERIKHYESVYEPVDDTLAYIRILQYNPYEKKVVTNRIKGYLASRAAFFLGNLQFAPRHIFLSRHGESEDNVLGKIGGDSSLSVRGREYAKKLAQFITEGKPENCDFRIWTSCLNRSIQTAEHFQLPTVRWKILNEIDAGICEGLTYKEIEEKYPEEFIARSKDKFNYRYPSGESYADLVQRLEPVIMELERQYDPVLVIGHQAILRVLYAYFTGKDAKECPHLDVPLHTIAQITPKAYSCEEQLFKLC